jgi:hypothetical protein
MNKKITGLMVAGVAVFALSGCGGGGGGDDYDPGPAPVTLFLLDEVGASWGGIPYLCDGMENWDVTPGNGEFTFYEYESCTFKFTGLDGNVFNDPLVDDIIRITDDRDLGVKDVEYECVSYGPDVSQSDGSFFYDFDDQCTFHFKGIY